MPLRLNIGLILLVAVLFSSCEKDISLAPNDTYILEVPKGFPQPNIPEDNQLSKSRVELGRKLFFDPILSNDYSISCASCHFPQNAFSDTVAISQGVMGRLGMRNSPSLANVGYSTLFFKDGGAPSLRQQAINPITDHNEMDLPFAEAEARVRSDAEYLSLFNKAYGETSVLPITRALEAFQFTLISGNSAFDKFYYHNDENALTESEKRGYALFQSTALNCSGCHNGFNFSNDDFENNGLYETYVDTGRARINGVSQDVGKFKVPSLRNIALTAPYMHDGSVATLSEVIDHYASGGSNHPNKNPLLTGFSLSSQEKEDLINFLNALTDWKFVSKDYKN